MGLTYDGRPVKAVEVEGTFKFKAFVFADRDEIEADFRVAPLDEQIGYEIADALEYRACNLTDAEDTDGLVVTGHGLSGGRDVKVSVRDIDAYSDWTDDDLLQQIEGRGAER